MTLLATASEVYDIEIEDIASGLDYSIQQANGTHLQDISVRCVIQRRGWNFEGNELVQIRGREGWGRELGSGFIPFHLPGLIENPRKKGWWQEDSVEDFYQSNKVLQVKATTLQERYGLQTEGSPSAP